VSEQTKLFAREPMEIVTEAIERFRPAGMILLYSGGNDSGVVAHWAWERHELFRSMCAELREVVPFHIDTGTALAENLQHAHVTASKYGWFEKRGTSWGSWERGCPSNTTDYGVWTYEDIVLNYGFPGPKQHRWTYIRLKERALDAAVQRRKRSRRDKVLLLSGVRASESRRRMGTSEAIQERGAKVWVAPFIDWTDRQMREYRARHGITENPVSPLLHVSGDCLCGAFARPGEMTEIETFFPYAAERIHRLEREAKKRGRLHCTWGSRHREVPKGAAPPMCTDCDVRVQMALEVDAEKEVA
jgi:3'-phosphoadenosine 5'-phosphosulfate sulfotransferase (PAPS reductase)/FAD synthetase